MSRLVPIKDIERVITDFAEREDHPTIHIAGDGPKRSALELLARRNRGDVQFHGFVSGAQKRALFERCRYFVISSKTIDGRHEGMPVSLLEACAAGLVPLVARFPGIDDVLDSRYIVDDGESFYERFQTLREESAPDGSRYGWETLGREWLRFVSSLG